MNDPDTLLKNLRENDDLIKAVRKTYPNILAQELTEVQPMTGDAGSIFKLRHVYVPWYKKLWNKISHFIMPKLGFSYVPTKMGCFGPTNYKWKKDKNHS